MGRLFALAILCCLLMVGCAGSSTSHPGLDLPGPSRGTYLSSSSQGDFTVALMNFILEEAGVTTRATSPVTVYSITYNTIDLNGNIVVASGAVAVPTNVSSAALLSYQHSTATAKNKVPSSGGYLEGDFVLSAFAGSGKYVVCMPDYLGLGSNSSPAIHPFMHALSEASASIDMIRATQQFLAQLSGAPSLNGKLFLAGYSQGGHATMATTKAIQETAKDLSVTASAPMAGPYDLSNTEMDFSIENPGPDTPVFMGYLAVAYNEIYGIYTSPSQVFISPYDQTAPPLYGANSDIDWIKSRLPDTAQQMFQATFLSGLQDPSSQVNKDLQANNLYNWKPTMPMRLYHAYSDDIVSYNNSLLAYTTMQGLGATQVQLVNLGTGLTHAEGIEPAVQLAREWFDTL
ncbi:MAG TPA: lipase family protein [Fimbriimonas sp.]|nr:lipase family protein [Fimbriimonas sp.]